MFKSTNPKTKLVSGYDYDITYQAQKDSLITEGESALLRLEHFETPFDWWGTPEAMKEMKQAGWVKVVETQCAWAYKITPVGIAHRLSLFKKLRK